MREIKFRGKSDNEWIYGMLLKTDKEDYGEHGDKHYDCEIQTEEEEYGQYNKYYITDNNTIGQYTGLKDKSGVEIYEGDILQINYKYKGKVDNIIALVKYSEKYAQFIIVGTREVRHEAEELGDYVDDDIEVIGNIYDNPELIEKEGNANE